MENEKPKLKIVGTDSNAFSLLGKACEIARKKKWTQEEISKMRTEATSGDYNHLLATLCEYFEVC